MVNQQTNLHNYSGQVRSALMTAGVRTTEDIPALGPVGPAQSDEVVHFTGKGGFSPTWLPQEIQRMKPEGRLDAIIASRVLKGFPLFGTTRACVCFSESPPDHLAHLITERGFAPWGIVLTRAQILKIGGGSVAYVPTDVHDRFKRAGLEHWAVRIHSNSLWMHEREWRVPLTAPGIWLGGVAAILIGNPTWRPTLVESDEWIDESTSEHCQGPEETPYAVKRKDLPELWRWSPIWVWDATSRSVAHHPPGTLF